MSASPTPSGILLIDKEEGISSFDVLRKLKKLGITQAGHCGTLDPFATGLLIVVCGKMTRFSDFFMHQRKKYTATIELGTQTDTADFTGTSIQKAPVPEKISPEKLTQIAASLTGRQKQLPPMYSAIKKDGIPLYEHARKGVEIAREEREIEIFQLSLRAGDSRNPEFPTLNLECEVSSGTYVRTLAETIAERLGTVGHLIALRRTESAGFTVENSYPSIEFKLPPTDEKSMPRFFTSGSFPENLSTKTWIPFADFLKNLPTCTLDTRLSRLAANGFAGIFEDTDFLNLVGEFSNFSFLILADEKNQPFRLLRKNQETQRLEFFISFDNVPNLN